MKRWKGGGKMLPATTVVKVPVTIADKTYDVEVECLGEGNIPLMIFGHAEVYLDLLGPAFERNGLLQIFTLYSPRLYWCEASPLSKLPVADITQNGLAGLVQHIEQVRQGLVALHLLETDKKKLGLYAHSGFSALAFQYAIDFPRCTLFIQAEGPTPFLTQDWSKEKKLFFNGNFRRKAENSERAQALAKLHIEPDESLIDEKAMGNFKNFRKAYQRMSPTLFWDFKQNHEMEIWHKHVLNMPLFKAYFSNILVNYDARKFFDKIQCPIHLSLGLYDVAVPYYLWVDSTSKKGLGFFEKCMTVEQLVVEHGVNKSKKRKLGAYDIHTQSGHWPMLEEAESYCQGLLEFITKLQPELMPENTIVTHL